MNPYKNDAINNIYDLLFCDDLAPYKATSPTGYPWEILFTENAANADLQRIIDDRELETRPKILAAGRLRDQGSASDERRIFGVIIEVGLDEGLDVLAAYEDKTARYINHSEKIIVWDTKTQESDALVSDLFSSARTVVDRIGPWDGPRREPPTTGNIRLSFLVSNGLYFGEGPFDVLARDQMAGPVIDHSTRLMNFLVNTTLGQSR
jgi:hypothetical protein